MTEKNYEIIVKNSEAERWETCFHKWVFLEKIYHPLVNCDTYYLFFACDTCGALIRVEA